MTRVIKYILPIALGIVLFTLWNGEYACALSYQEQYQLFLFSKNYFWRSLSVAGGLADWVSEFLVQFYYIQWIGAAILALLYVALQQLIYYTTKNSEERCNPLSYLLSFIPVLLLLRHMGDENVLLSYPIALLLTLLITLVMDRRRPAIDLLLLPLLYWLLGASVWVYAGMRALRLNKKWLWMPLWLLAIQLICAFTLLQQWPWINVLCGINYYRIPLTVPLLQVLIPIIIITLSLIHKKAHTILLLSSGSILYGGGFIFALKGFDPDKYELIRQDYLIRNQQWDELLARAEKQVVRTAFWSQSTNLALAMKGELAERMFQFYQSGEDALLMPMIRDMTSDLPTAEAFYRLGMVNSAYRYMFDIQQSILNARMSGRCLKRMTECCIINGMYKVAGKYIALLKQSLFYKEWAEEAETYLGNEAKINAHPEWGRIRRLRYKEDFLFNYEEKDKMLGLLFVNNPENRMALDYFMGEMLLKGDINGFMHYMSWVKQYGGYSRMPAGYSDAIQCIQKRGELPGSHYATYVKRMIEKNK